MAPIVSIENRYNNNCQAKRVEHESDQIGLPRDREAEHKAAEGEWVKLMRLAINAYLDVVDPGHTSVEERVRNVGAKQ